MTTRGMATRDEGATIEEVLIGGDLSKLSAGQRVNYYNQLCASLGVNPLTRPFDYLTLNGRLVLYAKKDCTDQLRKLRGVSVTKLEHSQIGTTYVVTAYGTDREGRIDSASGAVYLGKKEGDEVANGIMKAETKAKRRLTLSLCGLGMTDESEIDSIPDARRVVVDHDTGEISTVVNHPPAQPSLPDVISSADDPLWQRYLVVLAEAQGLGVKHITLCSLPISRMQLVSAGQAVREAIKGREQELADQEADNLAAQVEQDGETAPLDPWARNRELGAQAARLKIKTKTLPNETPLEAVSKENDEIAARIEAEFFRRAQIDQQRQSL